MILALGDYMSVQCHACIGGTNIGEDIRKLDYGQHVVAGTPGRVFDMIRRRNLRTRAIKMLVSGQLAGFNFVMSAAGLSRFDGYTTVDCITYVPQRALQPIFPKVLCVDYTWTQNTV